VIFVAKNGKDSNNPLHGLGALINRELTKWFKNPVVFIITIVQPVFWLGLLGKGMNLSGLFTANHFPSLTLNPPPAQQQLIQINAYFSSLQSHIMTNLFGVPDYFSFVACGIIIMLTLMATTYSSTSVVLDRRFGFIDKLLSTSVSKTTVIISKIISGTLRALVQAVILLGIAFLFGLTTGTNFSPLSILGVVAIIFLFGMGMSSIFVAASLRSTRLETQSAFINFVNMPLVFASSAFFPASLMPSWLQTVVNANPTSYAIDAIRRFLIDSSGLGNVAVDFLYVGAFAIITTTISIVLSWRFLSK
jgi:ABC-2 type transport system permease protein